jgi:hypothetical protein
MVTFAGLPRPHRPVDLPLPAPSYSDRLRTREKMISQNPPKQATRQPEPTRLESILRPADLPKYIQNESGAKRARTADPLLAKQVLFQLSYSPVGVCTQA